MGLVHLGTVDSEPWREKNAGK